MNIDEFWEIIEKGNYSDDSVSIVGDELKKLSLAEIASYQTYFNKLHEQAYQWNLWGAAYVIGGGCSDDGFTDFRYGLISQGKEIYENAIEDPDSLACLGENADLENELFGYVAQKVYEEVTGKEIPRSAFKGTGEPAGQEWDFDDEELVKKHYPKLAVLFL